MKVEILLPLFQFDSNSSPSSSHPTSIQATQPFLLSVHNIPSSSFVSSSPLSSRIDIPSLPLHLHPTNHSFSSSLSIRMDHESHTLRTDKLGHKNRMRCRGLPGGIMSLMMTEERGGGERGSEAGGGSWETLRGGGSAAR